MKYPQTFAEASASSACTRKSKSASELLGAACMVTLGLARLLEELSDDTVTYKSANNLGVISPAWQ